MRTPLVIAVVTILASASSISAADRPTAKDLLTAYQASVEKLSRVQIEGSVSESRTGIATTWATDTTVIRDADRWKVNGVTKITVPASETRPKPWQQTILIQTLAGCEMIQANELLTTQLIDPNLEDPQAYAITAYLDEHANRIFSMLGLTSILFGRIPGDGALPLWKIMGEETALELHPEAETIDGGDTYLLTSRGKYGEHKVWFDPASGGLPRRIEVRKHNGNLVDDEQLGSRPTPKAHVETLYKIDNIKIEKKNGVFVVASFDCNSGYLSESGEAQYGRGRSFRLRTIEVDPKSLGEETFRFGVKIPNGLSIGVHDKAALRLDQTARPAFTFEWRDGRPQRRIGR